MMAKKATQPAPRKPRSDAQRNRAHLIEVATEVFTRRGADASMDEIAKLAKVGPGTLYRHFPTRDALLTEVYRSEVEKLGEAQTRLSATLPPVEALRAWLIVFIDYMDRKQVLWPIITAREGGATETIEPVKEIMPNAIATLVANAVASGDIRSDIDPMDLLRAVYGVSLGSAGADWPARARQMVDILIAGSRP